MTKRIFFITACCAGLAACSERADETPAVFAAFETAPVASSDDAADDPAIWVNMSAPAESRILGTDKQAGLYVYNLAGEVVQFLPIGELNNVDLRQEVTLGGWTGDLAAATNRTDNTVTIFTIENGEVTLTGALPSVLDEPYGICMGKIDGGVAAFVAYKTGDLVMYQLNGPGGGEAVARLKFDSQLEGCVYDDELNVLYIGEELRGIWKAPLSGGAFAEPTLVDEVGGETGVAADVEGLALYKTGPAAGYLLASSQGNDSFAVYRREGDNAFVTRFRIGDGEMFDGAEETDGIEAVSVSLGADFPLGLFIAQDGHNDPKGTAQNFKAVDWRQIEKVIKGE